jgi:hypothetical protein
MAGQNAPQAPRRAVRSVPLDLASADELNFRFLIEYWQGKHAGGRLPGRTAIDPLELKRVLPHLLLIDVEREPLDFRYRLAGTLTYDIFGFDLTGRRVRDIPPPEWGETVWRSLAEMVETRAPQYVRLDFTTAEGNIRSYRVLRLPLAEDGVNVDCLLVMGDFGLHPREFRADLDAAFGTKT